MRRVLRVSREYCAVDELRNLRSSQPQIILSTEAGLKSINQIPRQAEKTLGKVSLAGRPTFINGHEPAIGLIQPAIANVFFAILFQQLIANFKVEDVFEQRRDEVGARPFSEVVKDVFLEADELIAFRL